MVLAGHTGQPSLGHGSLPRLRGVYAGDSAGGRRAVPDLAAVWLVSSAGVVGAIVAIPALKMSGIYLAIATLAFGIMVEDVIILLEHWTGGVEGVLTPAITIAAASKSTAGPRRITSIGCV